MTDKLLQKIALRKSLIQRRGLLDAISRAQKNQSIYARLITMPEVLKADNIFCFISYGSEVDTRLALDWFHQHHKLVAVPKIINRDEMIAVGFNGWDNMVSGPVGVPQPSDSKTFSADIDLCITPGIGFTLTGQRLGHGQGYYDKWFARHQVRHKLALCYECQIVEELPYDEFDVPVDTIITEHRIIRV